MCSGTRSATVVVVIEIWVDTTQPLAGRVVLGDDPPHPFAGWLQLLGILVDAVTREGGDAQNRSEP